MEFSLTIVRHGNTLATEKNLYCGITDLNLTIKGKKEILTFKNRNVYHTCDIFFTS